MIPQTNISPAMVKSCMALITPTASITTFRVWGKMTANMKITPTSWMPSTILVQEPPFQHAEKYLDAIDDRRPLISVCIDGLDGNMRALYMPSARVGEHLGLCRIAGGAPLDMRVDRCAEGAESALGIRDIHLEQLPERGIEEGIADPEHHRHIPVQLAGSHDQVISPLQGCKKQGYLLRVVLAVGIYGDDDVRAALECCLDAGLEGEPLAHVHRMADIDVRFPRRFSRGVTAAVVNDDDRIYILPYPRDDALNAACLVVCRDDGDPFHLPIPR